MEKETNSQTLEKVKQTTETPDVDLCVMIDCTGSMGSYIEMSRNKIKDIIGQVKASYPSSEVRIAIVAYRDIKDNKRFEVLKFTILVDEAKIFLDQLNAEGGEDTPEDVNGAFQKALYSINWENPVRLLVHIADAPCHGKEFHSCDDSYPKGHQSDASWDKIFKSLVDLRLDYLFLKIDNITDKMFQKFKEIAKIQGSDTYELSFTQEIVNSSSNVNQGDKSEKKVSHADHFAATITEKVKSSLDKELKKGFQKKLEKRTSENSNLVEKIKKSITQIIEKIDFEKLKKKHSDLSSKIGECILSSNNFIEALADEDCLCLTFNIGRSQAAIVDPTQIIIKDVYPSFLTAGSFFYSTEFALKKNKLAHGGYEKNADGLIVKGAAQENITGVMPLYLCEENWEVAKLLMKLTIAWAVTLDPSGYVYTQIKTVPFMILAKLAGMLHEKPESQFLAFQFKLVKETCVQLMKDGSQKDFTSKFDEEILDLYHKYEMDTSVRTIDSISNNTVFLAQLYIAQECGLPLSKDIHFDNFVKALLEEELRRKLYPLEETVNVNIWRLNILNVDTQKMVIDPIEDYKKANITAVSVPIHEKEFLKKLEELKKNPSETIKSPELKSKFEIQPEETKTELTEFKKEETAKGEIRNEETIIEESKIEETITMTSFLKNDFENHGKYNEVQERAIKDHKNIFKKVLGYLYPLIKLIKNMEIDSYEKFSSWGIDNNAKFFALYIQNKLQTKNADRREAFKTKNYMNPWTQSNEYILHWIKKSIEDEKIIGINQFISNKAKIESNDKAGVFAYSENLNEAAGALMGSRIGDTNFRSFHLELCKGSAILVHEKVKMLLQGNYLGVRLFKDLKSWNMGKKKRNKLSKAYGYVIFIY